MVEVDTIKEKIPATTEIKAQLDKLFCERQFLRQLLKLAEKRDAVAEQGRAACK